MILNIITMSGLFMCPKFGITSRNHMKESGVTVNGAFYSIFDLTNTKCYFRPGDIIQPIISYRATENNCDLSPGSGYKFRMTHRIGAGANITAQEQAFTIAQGSTVDKASIFQPFQMPSDKLTIKYIIESTVFIVGGGKYVTTENTFTLYPIRTVACTIKVSPSSKSEGGPNGATLDYRIGTDSLIGRVRAGTFTTTTDTLTFNVDIMTTTSTTVIWLYLGASTTPSIAGYMWVPFTYHGAIKISNGSYSGTLIARQCVSGGSTCCGTGNLNCCRCSGGQWKVAGKNVRNCGASRCNMDNCAMLVPGGWVNSLQNYSPTRQNLPARQLCRNKLSHFDFNWDIKTNTDYTYPSTDSILFWSIPLGLHVVIRRNSDNAVLINEQTPFIMQNPGYETPITIHAYSACNKDTYYYLDTSTTIGTIKDPINTTLVMIRPNTSTNCAAFRPSDATTTPFKTVSVYYLPAPNLTYSDFTHIIQNANDYASGYIRFVEATDGDPLQPGVAINGLNFSSSTGLVEEYDVYPFPKPYVASSNYPRAIIYSPDSVRNPAETNPVYGWPQSNYTGYCFSDSTMILNIRPLSLGTLVSGNVCGIIGNNPENITIGQYLGYVLAHESMHSIAVDMDTMLGRYFNEFSIYLMNNLITDWNEFRLDPFSFVNNGVSIRSWRMRKNYQNWLIRKIYPQCRSPPVIIDTPAPCP